MIIEKFREDLDLLKEVESLGIKPGLDRMKKLLSLLGNPEKDLPCIHIAGTNGKGSISCYCANICAAADLKVGWFSSPYLENFNERIRIVDGRQGLLDWQADYRLPEISDVDFRSFLSRTMTAVRRMKDRGWDLPTEFELLTAVAFLYFAEKDCQIVVLEVGMGGRLDSTNVIEKPRMTIISSLAYDHMARLGNTLAEIAGEKAGIIKQGCPLVFADPADSANSPADQAAAYKVVMERAKELAAPVTVFSQSEIDDLVEDWQGQSFSLDGFEYRLSMPGAYQRQNAGLAIKACRQIFDQATVAQGLALSRWRGRLEILREEPAVLIDGAHNEAGVLALKNYLNQFFSGRKLVFLLGILADKQTDRMLADLFKDTDYQPVTCVCTEVNNPRSARAQDLAEQLVRLGAFSQMTSLEAFERKKLEGKSEILYTANRSFALRQALELAETQGMTLVVCGSLYLLGEVRPQLVQLLKAKMD